MLLIIECRFTGFFIRIDESSAHIDTSAYPRELVFHGSASHAYHLETPRSHTHSQLLVGVSERPTGAYGFIPSKEGFEAACRDVQKYIYHDDLIWQDIYKNSDFRRRHRMMHGRSKDTYGGERLVANESRGRVLDGTSKKGPTAKKLRGDVR